MSAATSKSRSDRKPLFHFWRCFWLTFLVLSLAYAWYCFYVPSNSIAWAESFDAAQTQAVQSDKPVILYFTGEWCVPCRIMKRKVWADEEVMETINSAFVPVMIDVGDAEAANAMRRFQVAAAPSTIIIDSKGNVLQHRQGEMDKAEFLEFLGAASPSATDHP